MTQGVVKNIIPAIASTNAIIAASCCNEAFKIATTSAPYLDNYMMYTGNESIYTFTFQHQKKDDCPVCGNLAQDYEVNPEWTLQDLIDRMLERPDTYVLSSSFKPKNKMKLESKISLLKKKREEEGTKAMLY